MPHETTLAAEVFRYCRAEIAKSLADTAQEISAAACLCESLENIEAAIALNQVAIALATRARDLTKCPERGPFAEINERNH